MTNVVFRDQSAAFGQGSGPWSPPPQASGPKGSGGEPAFRAPWPALVIAGAILGLYAVQSRSPRPQQIEAALGFSPADLASGHWAGLITALFVHAGWTHAFFNAVAALAFGAPVARLFGRGPWRALVFFAFYIACGILGSLGFYLLHPGSPDLLIGASGAVAGLMGAASRLLQGAGRLAPFTSAPVMGMGVSWIVINLLLAVFGLTVLSGGAPIAWEAHLFGYAAGLLAVGPVAHLLGRGKSSGHA